MLADLLRKRPVLANALPAALFAAVLVLLADQLIKQFVVETLNLRNVGAIQVFPGFNLRMAWNTGVNFGLLSTSDASSRWILAIGTTVVAVILVVASRACHRLVSCIGLGVAAGGALGNTIDRFNWGAVADFLNVSCCGIDNPWSFNVADIAIFVGFGLLLIPLPKRAAASPQTPTS